MQINLLENLDTEGNCLVQFSLWRDQKLLALKSLIKGVHNSCVYYCTEYCRCWTSKFESLTLL